MSLLRQLQLATQAYLKYAYPDEVPVSIRDKTTSLCNLEDDDQLVNWEAFEREENRYLLRLGNHRYPHMKLVLLLESQKPVFYVDAHDAHFTLPPDVPGYEQLLHLREANKRLKGQIEAAWTMNQLPVFGHQRATVKHKKICEGMQVMAIDDEVQILDMLGIIVTSLGATFLRAESADAARSILENECLPDLIFCDIMMPGESGLDFVTWLEQNYPDIRVCFITGLSQEKIEQIEIAEVLQKPFNAKSVMKIMKGLQKQNADT